MHITTKKSVRVNRVPIHNVNCCCAVLCAKVRASDRNPCLLEGLCMRYLANLMVEFFQRYVYSPKMFSAIVILKSLEVRLRDDIWLSFVRVYGLKVYTSYK